MREIKFKYIFKHRKDGDIQTDIFTLDRIQSKDFESLLMAWINDGYELVDRCLYMEKNDINDKEIYEHYICKDKYGRIFIVQYLKHFLRWQLNPLNQEATEQYKHSVDIFSWTYPEMCLEVIGNIYSNPELLTKE